MNHERSTGDLTKGRDDHHLRWIAPSGHIPNANVTVVARNGEMLIAWRKSNSEGNDLLVWKKIVIKEADAVRML
jgi:hypothetical protein